MNTKNRRGNMELVRLQKFLADCGIASRRKCEEYIIQGRVKVNNEIATLGMKINPETDIVLFDNKKIENINAKEKEIEKEPEKEEEKELKE